VTPAASTLRFDVQNYLTTAEDRAAYLEAALEDGDTEIIATSLGEIARDRRRRTRAPVRRQSRSDLQGIRARRKPYARDDR
jgi:probable addiction module antidote protein